MKRYQLGKILIILSISIMLFTAACSSNTETPSPSPTPPPKSIEITIGQLADQTGTVAMGYWPDGVIEDLAKYYNTKVIIPNVTLNVITYDTSYDPAKTVPGYEKLKQDGADLMFTQKQFTAPVLKSRLNSDEIVLFAPTYEEDAFDPPGYVFGLGTLPQYEIITLLSWIAGNDWDWENKGPAKIGAAMWCDDYGEGLIDGLKAYCSEHPDQFELVDAFLTDTKFRFASEAALLTECDYVLPPVPPMHFMKDFRFAGAATRYIGTTSHASFMSDMIKSGVQEEANGTLIVLSYPWLTNESEGKFSDIAKAIAENCDSWMGHIDTDDCMDSPFFQHTVQDAYIIMNAIEHAIHTYGNENFSSQTFFESLKTFSIDMDGFVHSFSDAKRTSNETLGIYRIDAENETLVRADPDWIPIMTEP